MQKVKEFFQKYKSEILLFVLFIYVIILGLGVISEVFDLGWFKWL